VSSYSKDIFVSKGYKPFWKLLFPYGCFVLALVIWYNVWGQFEGADAKQTTVILLGTFFVTLILTLAGIYFARIIDYHFDFTLKRYKIVKRVGSIGFGSWKRFENLSYISLFENLDNLYQINLWYNTHEHFSIDTFWSYDESKEVALDIATRLDIEFYNAVEAQRSIYPIPPERKVRDEDRQVNVHITQGNRPLWRTIVSISLLAIAVFGFYYVIGDFNIDVKNQKMRIDFFPFLFSSISFIASFWIATVQDYQFDFKNDQFKHIFRVGPLKYGFWEAMDSLDYVSVYKEADEKIKVNLWYNKNQMVTFATYNSSEMALKVGKVLAKKLGINVWDVTDPMNGKQIDL